MKGKGFVLLQPPQACTDTGALPVRGEGGEEDTLTNAGLLSVSLVAGGAGAGHTDGHSETSNTDDFTPNAVIALQQRRLAADITTKVNKQRVGAAVATESVPLPLSSTKRGRQEEVVSLSGSAARRLDLREEAPSTARAAEGSYQTPAARTQVRFCSRTLHLTTFSSTLLIFLYVKILM